MYRCIYLELMAEPDADGDRADLHGERVGDSVPKQLQKAGQVGHMTGPLVQQYTVQLSPA